MKLLIVDDDLRRRSSLKEYLQKALHLGNEAISVASCYDEARRLLRSNYYDALVLDVILPKRANGLMPSADFGLSLLDELHRRAHLKRPEKIIGISAFAGENPSFRIRFEDHCNVVIDSNSDSDSWREKIANSIAYTKSSLLSRVVAERATAVFTIHGIRTYGSWQDRLRDIIEQQTESVEFFTYKYGYFSALSFLIPRFRQQEIDKLLDRVRQILDGSATDRRIVVYCHSFGTYLAVKAIEALAADWLEEPELTLALTGSVLDVNYDWSFFKQSRRIFVVNDCGCDDKVLWLSKLFGTGLGMAGRSGFNGFNSPRFINRYHRGGHSLYFDNQDFMHRFWIPLLNGGGGSIDLGDKRVTPTWIGTLADSLISRTGLFGGALLLAVAGAASLYALSLF